MPHMVDQDSPFVNMETRLSRHWHCRSIIFDRNEIFKCEFFLSSTIHGIIISDSYGIPNAHMKKLTDKVKGEYHKFDHGYFQSVYRYRTSSIPRNTTIVEEKEVLTEVEDYGRHSAASYDISRMN
jgi:hypothetical protein